MSERKPAKRKTRTKPPPLAAKPLRALGKETLEYLPRPSKDGSLRGIPLPPDLEPATRYYAGREMDWLEDVVGIAPWELHDDISEEDYPGWKDTFINPRDWSLIRGSLEDCFRRGFYLALLRYADDLITSAEAGPILERLRRNAPKGGGVRRKEAAPKHKAICKRFRELRRTVPKKTARYLRIAGEFGMSEGQIRRIISDAEIE